MADQKPEDDPLLREIDDELKQDQYLKLWQAYGKYAVALAVVLILGVAGHQGWTAYDRAQRLENTASFQAALKLTADNKADAALEAFARIANEAGAGIAMLARFQEARLLAAKGDGPGAAAAYRTLAGDPDVDTLYRDVAQVLGAMQELNVVGADPAEISRRIAPLAADTSPWRHMAREIQALAATRAGERNKARELYAALTADKSAPEGVRQRAQEMLSILAR